MKAYRLQDWQQPAELCDVDVPSPGPGEVLVRVGGAGACHSDLHILEYAPGSRPWSPPFTLGHENAGWVAELGAGVDGLDVGEAVAVYGPWGCGRCRACRLSRENHCQRMRTGPLGGGLGRDGGMAEYLLVPAARLLVPLGDLHPSEAAPLTDAALTPYHAIKRSLHRLGPGSTAVAIGVGGLGHLGVQLLRTLSPAQVVAVDLDADKLALAAEVGADETVLAGADAPEQVRELTGGMGADLVLDFVGAAPTIELAAGVAGVDSDVTVVGAAGGTIAWRRDLLPVEATLTSTFWGSGIDLIDVLELAREGRIRAHVERFPLDGVAEAYARLATGDVRGRAVIVPHAS